MSRIYFHSPSGNREIYGRERAWMGCLCDEIANGILVGVSSNMNYLIPLMPSDAYPVVDARREQLGSAVRFGDMIGGWSRDHRNHFIVDGEQYNAWEIGLNTVLTLGNDPVKLCARLHAQCEIHGYVEGSNRRWLAGIIREGLKIGVMRSPSEETRDDVTRVYDPGWGALADFLEVRDDEPVVCSYSICDQFPNRSAAGWKDANDGDDWYALPSEERWELGMTALRNDGPEMKPDGWAEYRFSHNKNAFWLLEQGAKIERKRWEAKPT